MVHERIADYLTDKGIKQSFLVRETGMSANAISCTLKGERKLTVEEYAAICNALGVKPSAFFDDGNVD